MQYSHVDISYIPWTGTLSLKCFEGTNFEKIQYSHLSILSMPWIGRGCFYHHEGIT
jgi:hypothetical protein